MSVNKFGAGVKSSSAADRYNVSNKIKVLTLTKVDKYGDEMIGDLNIRLNEDNLRSFGVTDIKSGKSVSFLLGDVDNQIRHNHGHSVKVAASHGLKVTCPGGEVCRMGSQNDASAWFYKNINMNDSFIKGLHHPAGESDAATKLYVDSRCVKNSVGFVPNLTRNVNKNGFVVSASSEVAQFEAFNVFNSTGTEWLSAENTSFWIEIKCPEPVRIHKIALRGVQTGVIRNWILQGGIDDDVWEYLYDNYMDSENTSKCIDHDLLYIENDSIQKFSTYRIWVNNADGERPGLSYWQMFSVDSIV